MLIHPYLRSKKVLALFALALGTFASLFLTRPALAQWSVTDPNGDPVYPYAGAYTLAGIPTGSAQSSYPQDITSESLAYEAYQPNPFDWSYLYGSGTSPLQYSLYLES